MGGIKPEANAMADSTNRMHSIAPLFKVADVVKAAAYYRDALGFDYEQIWGEPPCFCMPTRDGQIFMLSEAASPKEVSPNGSDGETWDAYVWVDDADALFEEFKANGAKLAYEPTDRPFYGNREFAVRDIDGYVIAFAHSL